MDVLKSVKLTKNLQEAADCSSISFEVSVLQKNLNELSLIASGLLCGLLLTISHACWQILLVIISRSSIQ